MSEPVSTLTIEEARAFEDHIKTKDIPLQHDIISRVTRPLRDKLHVLRNIWNTHKYNDLKFTNIADIRVARHPRQSATMARR